MNKLLKTKKSKKKIDKIYLHYFKPDVELNDFEFIEVQKLGKIKDNSLTEIIIQDLLEFNDHNTNTAILNKVLSKLKSGGILHIQGLDIKAMCYGVVYSQIDTIAFKTLVFGQGKNNIYTIAQIKKLITNEMNNLFDIQKIKFMNGLQYYIECSKK